MSSALWQEKKQRAALRVVTDAVDAMWRAHRDLAGLPLAARLAQIQATSEARVRQVLAEPQWRDVGVRQ